MYKRYYFYFEGFTFKVYETFQQGNLIKGHATLELAEEACLSDSKCTMIADFSCTEYLFWTCSGPVVSSYDETCTWVKGIYLLNI